MFKTRSERLLHKYGYYCTPKPGLMQKRKTFIPIVVGLYVTECSMIKQQLIENVTEIYQNSFYTYIGLVLYYYYHILD